MWVHIGIYPFQIHDTHQTSISNQNTKQKDTISIKNIKKHFKIGLAQIQRVPQNVLVLQKQT